MNTPQFKHIAILLTFFEFSSPLFAEPILLATSTSTENSGLLDVILPQFEQSHQISVRVLATGTGKAIRLGENGDVDVILTHAPKQEITFMKNGFGIKRQSVMHNHFVIVGPKYDPANAFGSQSITEVFSKIATSQSAFVSRGDESGTHIKEMELWQQANIKPQGQWYKSVGQGMGKSLHIASELGAYLLIDRGTWLKFKSRSDLRLIYHSNGNEQIMFNPYSVVLVNPDKHPHIKHQAAKTFADWLTSPAVKSRINGYLVGGVQLFFAP